MLFVRIFIVVFALLFISLQIVSAEDRDSTKSLILKGKTIQEQLGIQSRDSSAFNLPGVTPVFYSAQQDSAYFRSLSLHIPTACKIRHDLRRWATEWRITKSLKEESDWANAMRNLALPRAVFMPSDIEIVQHKQSIRDALYVPNMPLLLDSKVVTLQDAGTLLGLIEDVSPVMTFTLRFESEVRIVVYSMNAKVIATLYEGMLPAGKHTYTWNFRDSEGRPMPSGDYVGEVQIGTRRFQRKRINKP